MRVFLYSLCVFVWAGFAWVQYDRFKTNQFIATSRCVREQLHRYFDEDEWLNVETTFLNDGFINFEEWTKARCKTRVKNGEQF